MNGRRCQATTKDGAPCHAFALAGSAYCFTHGPERSVQREGAYRKGGQVRAANARYRKLWNAETSIRTKPKLWGKKVSSLEPKTRVLPHRQGGHAALSKKTHPQLEKKKPVNLRRGTTGPLPTAEDFILESMQD